jgi:hypothetical protein
MRNGEITSGKTSQVGITMPPYSEKLEKCITAAAALAIF